MIKKHLEHGWRVKKNKEKGMCRFGIKKNSFYFKPKTNILRIRGKPCGIRSKPCLD